MGQPLSAGAVHCTVTVVAVEDFRVSAGLKLCEQGSWHSGIIAEHPAGAAGVSGSGHERTDKAVERSDSAVVVTTLTCSDSRTS